MSAQKKVHRFAFKAAQKRLRMFPILTITGARQSGKTTFAKMLLPKAPYYTLENPDTRAFAKDDPRGFLRQVGSGAILDEVQRCPDLFSYLQEIVDADRRPGRFILTGSSQFHLLSQVTQSLAGRVSLLTMLPFSYSELSVVGRAPKTPEDALYRGMFPPVYDQKIDPTIWAQDYVGTYLERDVRQIANVKDLSVFRRFVQLCAGRVGQLINMSSLAVDAGIDRATAEAWLSILETSHIIFFVRPWFSNFSKRLIKTPKLYFCDTGIAAWLLGVTTPAHIRSHPQRGALFENWAISELLKSQTNAGRAPSIYFLRDKAGNEIDAFIETAPGTFAAVEIKSGETVGSDFFDGLDFWRAHLPKEISISPWLIYAGNTPQRRTSGTVLPWNALAPLLKTLSG